MTTARAIARVTTAAQAAALDASVIAAGTSSFALMERAGRAAAGCILARFAEVQEEGVRIFAGGGNNGGDGWVVATALREAGCPVEVVEVLDARTEDARRAREQFRAIAAETPTEAPAVVVDALLGTGGSGAPRDAVLEAIVAMQTLRDAGSAVVALDVPSGLDATTGVCAGACVTADLTVTFGTVKRGLLAHREPCGEIVACAIGVEEAPETRRLPRLVTPGDVAASVPRIGAQAHKGTRKRLVVIGGAPGMAGATVLAARGAARSGVGMVRLCVHPASLPPVQAAEPTATAVSWPTDEPGLRALCEYADVMLIGPGLGTSPEAQTLVARAMAMFRGPLVLDADALNAFAGKLHGLKVAIETHGHRPVILTPHPVEMGRLAGVNPGEVHTRRYEIAGEVARSTGTTVLLKGVPTVVSDGVVTQVVAAGTAVLATAGSGDVLGGIAATLLAQTDDPLGSAVAAAWVHGHAAEIAGAGRVRGVVLDDVLANLGSAWPEMPARAEFESVGCIIAELPAVP